jgi:pyruvate,water dikinase
MNTSYQYIRFFNEIGIDDIPLVGGKNASLGEMYGQLKDQHIKIPNGFAITAEAYRYMLDQAGVEPDLRELFQTLDANDMQNLALCGKKARQWVYGAGLPQVLQEEIAQAYQALVEQYGDDLSLAVRSSATAEDLPNASFAGQQDSYLNVSGLESLFEACRCCFASLFNDRAIHYRIDQGFDHFDVALSIAVMKMVRSDLASSGVMFTLDTESGFRDAVFITAAYGLGENVVQGLVEPDEFYVHKSTYQQGFRQILKRRLGSKKIKMIYNTGTTREATKNMVTSESERQRFCLSDDDVLTLAGYAIAIEKLYSRPGETNRPMDIEWAKDGLDGELYIVQARPETVISQTSIHVLEDYRLHETAPVIVSGNAVGHKIASGQAKVITHTRYLADFKAGEVLVADSTSPDWEPIMKIASAIVTNRGGRTCHAAIIARELGIPAVVGCNDATLKINDGTMLTVSCAEGQTGKVYDGALAFDVETTDLKQLPTPETRIMVNLGNPDLAFKTSFLPNAGVGLARMEFIINEYIKVHPMALLHPEQVSDVLVREQIAQLSKGYSTPTDFFVQRLAEGVGTIAAAFYPKPVVVRMSDFKSNEYAALLGGAFFEQHEENPMIGFRGASRYIHPAYREGFALECAAMQRVRDEMGLTNVILMIPFCRRVEEARQVLALMAELGLKQAQNGLQIYMMCEIPNNVILIDEFSQLFDGFSIGSNDLTQLTLGVDRDSAIVAHDFDERDEGVKTLLRLAIEGAHRNQRYCGICGQAPSDYPDMAEYLVELGIDSMSLNPDTVIQTTIRVLETEHRLRG